MTEISGVRAATASVSVTVVSVLPVFLLSGLAVQIGHDLRFGAAGLGLAVATYFGISALAAVPAGGVVERYGSAITSRIAVLVSTATLLAIAVAARSFVVLLVLLAIGAITNALGQLSSNLLLANAVPQNRQGFGFGVKQSAIPIATLLSGAAVPAIALTVGWRWAFALAGLVAIGALALVPPHVGELRGRAGRDGERATGALIVVGVAATLAAASANALGAFIVTSSVHRGLSPGLAGLTLTLGSAVCVAARLGGGWLADRRSGGDLLVAAGLLTVGAAGLGLLAVASPVALVVGVTLGFGLGWSWPGVMNFAVVRLNPSAPAAATSITQTGVYAGGCVGPLAFGALAGHLGYPAAWAMAAVSMLAAAGCMLLGAQLLHTWRAARTPARTPVPSPHNVRPLSGYGDPDSH
jgi:MFS family permease